MSKNYMEFGVANDLDRLDARVRDLSFISTVQRWETVGQTRRNLACIDILLPKIMQRMIDDQRERAACNLPWSKITAVRQGSGLEVVCFSKLTGLTALYEFEQESQNPDNVKFVAFQNPYRENFNTFDEMGVQSLRAISVLEIVEGLA